MWCLILICRVRFRFWIGVGGVLWISGGFVLFFRLLVLDLLWVRVAVVAPCGCWFYLDFWVLEFVIVWCCRLGLFGFVALLTWLGLCLFSGFVSWLVWFACELRCCVMLLACLVVVFLLVAACTLCCDVWRVWLCWLYY